MKKIKLISIMLVFSLIMSVCSPSIFAIGTENNDNISLPTGGFDIPKVYEMTEEEAKLAKELTLNNNNSNILKAPDLYAFSTNPYRSTYGYNKLSTQAEKDAYSILLYAASQFQGSESDAVYNSTNAVYNAISFSMTANNISISQEAFFKAYLTFIYDNPQIYFVESVGWTYYTDTGIIADVVLNCHPEYSLATTRSTLNTTMDAVIERYLDYVAPLKTDYEKEFIIHELLIQNLDYANDENGNPESSSWAHNIVGAFDNSTYEVVCEGYAKAFQLLCNASGIECVFVGGIGGGGGHAWNQVKLDNQWYNVDVTWDDGGTADDGDYYIRYTYFNAIDANFTDHTPFPSSATDNKWCYDVNKCTATTNSYANKGKVDYSDTVSVTYTSTDEIGFFVFNNGVNVESNTTVKPGAKLDIEIYAYTNNLVQDYDLLLNDSTKIAFEVESENTDTGVTTYTATCTALSEDMVFSLVPKGLKLNVSSLTFKSKGETKQLEATYGNETIDSSKLTFSTDNPYVASVNSSGKITSIGAGSATITVRYEDKDLETTLNVIGNQAYTLGDVNNDGSVDISDAYCMVRFLTYRLDTTPVSVLPAADFESTDPTISVSDVYAFIKYLANNI